MADVSVKMGVSGISQFKQGITEAAASVKTLDAALKTNEKQLKATGDKEAFMASQTNLLQGKIEALRNVAKNAEQALKQMEANGVSKTSKAYQDMQRKLVEAQGSILDAQQDMQSLGTTAVTAAGQTDKLASSLGGLNKRVSLEQVIGAIDSITGAMERAGGMAIDLGKKIWENVMKSAQWADDTQTLAGMWGIDVEQYQKMQKLVTNGMDTTVDNMLAAQDKLYKGIGSDNKAAIEALKELKVSLYELQDTGGGVMEFVQKDPQKVFFEIGRALYEMEEGYDKTSASQAIFGKSWRELSDLFKNYKSLEEYEAALGTVKVNSEEDVNALAELNEKVAELKGNLTTLSNEVWAKLAPALTDGANALNGLLESLLDYLETDKGKEMLETLGKAVSGLFEDLSNIDPQEVINGFTGVFTTITEGVQWLDQNKQGVVDALKYIVEGWAALKITGGALQIVKLFEGITGMAGGGAASAGAAAGASWGAAFASAVAKVAPWLVGAYALLNPAEGGNDSPFDNKNGMMTNEGWRYFEDYAAGRLKDAAWDEIIELVGNRYGGLSDILANPAAINAMAKALYGDHNFIGIDPKAQPDAYRQRINNELFAALEGMGYEPKIEIEPAEEVKEILEKGTIELTVGDSTGRIRTPSGWKEPAIQVEPIVAEDAASVLSKQIGPVPVPVSMVFSGAAAAGLGGVVGNLDQVMRQEMFRGMRNEHGFANGLPWVPFDGYPAILHQGERVLTARENRNYTFNNNTYFGGVSLHNGLEVEALTESIAARNAKVASGYGAN